MARKSASVARPQDKKTQDKKAQDKRAQDKKAQERQFDDTKGGKKRADKAGPKKPARKGAAKAERAPAIKATRDRTPAGAGARETAAARAATTEGVVIRIYDFQNLPFLPADAIADPAHHPLHAESCALMREVLAFWREAFGRRSYDGEGRRVVMFLRYPSGGGFYDPDLEAMRFSGPWPFEGIDGRRYYFGDFARSPDYVAHEFAHAVTAYCARLDYREAEQAGLHESLSDCFALAFRHWRARRADAFAPVEWRFGAGTALPPLSCTRNLAEPGDPRAWQRGFVHVAEVRPDAQGRIDPYAIAAIPSLAFRRVAQALGEDIFGAARLWQAALADPRMLGVKTFGAFADLTVLCAQRMVPEMGATLERAARGAWASVGVGVGVPLAV